MLYPLNCPTSEATGPNFISSNAFILWEIPLVSPSNRWGKPDLPVDSLSLQGKWRFPLELLTRHDRPISVLSGQPQQKVARRVKLYLCFLAPMLLSSPYPLPHQSRLSPWNLFSFQPLGPFWAQPFPNPATLSEVAQKKKI